MRIELDKPLTKTKLRQIIKLLGNGSKVIKVIMGTEIFDIDTIVQKNDTVYLCTDSKATSDFYEKRVIEDLPDEKEIKPYHYTITYSNDWKEKWEKYRKEHGLPPHYVGDTPGFGDDVTCKNQE